MKERLSLTVAVCLFLTATAGAQSFLKVNETATRAYFSGQQLQTDLAIENAAPNVGAKVRLEILDAEDQILGQTETSQTIRRGSQSVPVTVAFSRTEEARDLLWKRLRYTISPDGSSTSVSGIVSLSEIMPEIFELQITAPQYVYAGMQFRAHASAYHPATKKPIRNVTLTGELTLELDTEDDEDELVIKAKGKTNHEGFVTLLFEIPAGVRLEDAEIIVRGEKNGIRTEADTYLEINGNALVYLYTDKPLYQPKQKLYLRGVYLNPLKRPLADQELEIEFLDEENETVHEATVRTSRFGVFSVEWAIPENFKLGKYRVEVENDDGDELGTTEFKVTRYDLPNFTVRTEADKSFYLPEQKRAEISVAANYLFGQPVARGRVRLVQEAMRRWNEDDDEDDEDQAPAAPTYEGETDGAGRFVAAVDLSAAHENLQSQQWKRFADVPFVAYFTDTSTGRTEQKRFDVRVTKESIHVYFIRSDADVNPRLPFPFYVSTFYADGTPARCDLDIKGSYRGTDLRKDLGRARTNSFGASKLEIRLPDRPDSDVDKQYLLEIYADDKKGARGSLTDNLYVNENGRQIQLKTEKAIYFANEPLDVRIASSEPNEIVLVDVLKNSGVIYSKRVKLHGGRAALTIPYRPEFRGELTIAAYFRDEDDERYVIHSKTVIYPSPNGLDLNIKSLKPLYRPGEEARIAFQVRGGDGRPAEAALGVVVMDKAIEERAQTERLPDNYKNMRRLIGTGNTFGDLTRRDLDYVDPRRPVSEDLQLAAEFLLVNKTFEPISFTSDSYRQGFREIYKNYLTERLQPVEDFLTSHYRNTGDFPTDADSLRRILAAGGLQLEQLRDAWQMPLRARFSTDRAHLVLSLETGSADKIFDTEDDFTARQMRFAWFGKTAEKLNLILSEHVRQNLKAPQTVDDLKAIWKEAGVDFDALRDGWNRPLYLHASRQQRDTQKAWIETIGSLDGERQQVTRMKLVAQDFILFRILSRGPDGIEGVYDDFELGSLMVVLAERDLSVDSGGATISTRPLASGSGAIGGTLQDPTGAVIPGATVSAVNQNSNEVFSARSNERGEFLIINLPSGKYKVTATALGFNPYTIENVVVSSMNLIQLEIALQVGHVTETVTVSALPSMSVEQSSASISSRQYVSERSLSGILNGVQAQQTATPRVREYFPETLLWQPELVTDKAGRAELKFKLADSLTTWKLFTFGSSETGEFALIEKEFQTFQPFFAELDPPRILTEGDEIALPVPIRNYTDRPQKVAVSMAPNEWSRMLGTGAQSVDVAANSSHNAIFNFQAAAPVVDGRQKITALARREGDAIEKPVTVRPNGREFVETDSRMFDKETSFTVNFPENSFPNTRRAELKIYPSMLTHVAESIEGLLKRPYGCGEQTISSTYPNLLILKIEKELKKEIDPGVKTTAQSYLAQGYQRLLNYQTDSGGFSFWGRSDQPNPALTAYALRFLTDAGEFIEIDEQVVQRAGKWLLSQQSADGSWTSSRNGTETMTAYIVRSLSLVAGDEAHMNAVRRGVHFLYGRLPQINDPYLLANLALAATEIGESQITTQAVRKLAGLQTPEKEMLYWTTAGTPFYGWGSTAGIETTALALQALLRFRKQNPALADNELDRMISGAAYFLLRSKDRYGVWYSTQTTVNVLDALVFWHQSRSAANDGTQSKTEIFVNGRKVRELVLDGRSLHHPVMIDLAPLLDRPASQIEIRNAGDADLTTAQVVSTYYISWNEVRPEEKSYFDFKAEFDKTEARIGEDITVRVRAQRETYRRYGMVLAEIGLPPGADVDRESLEKMRSERRLSSFDVLPDRVVVYAWVDAEPLSFSFKFRPRFGIDAQNAPSVVSDYYNEEARAWIAPVRFSVK